MDKAEALIADLGDRATILERWMAGHISCLVEDIETTAAGDAAAVAAKRHAIADEISKLWAIQLKREQVTLIDFLREDRYGQRHAPDDYGVLVPLLAKTENPSRIGSDQWPMLLETLYSVERDILSWIRVVHAADELKASRGSLFAFTLRRDDVLKRHQERLGKLFPDLASADPNDKPAADAIARRSLGEIYNVRSRLLEADTTRSSEKRHTRSGKRGRAAPPSD